MIREVLCRFRRIHKLYFEYSLRFKKEKHIGTSKLEIDNLKHMILKMKLIQRKVLDIAVEDRSLKSYILQTLDIML